MNHARGSQMVGCRGNLNKLNRLGGATESAEENEKGEGRSIRNERGGKKRRWGSGPGEIWINRP